MEIPIGLVTVDVNIHSAHLIGAQCRLVLLGELTLPNILPGAASSANSASLTLFDILNTTQEDKDLKRKKNTWNILLICVVDPLGYKAGKMQDRFCTTLEPVSYTGLVIKMLNEE